MAEFEKEWAKALKKSKQKTVKQKTVPLNIQKEQVQEEIDHFKKELLTAAKKGSRPEAETILEKIIKLRAKQLDVLLQNFEKFFGQPTEDVVNLQFKKYYHDCLQLTRSVEILLAQKHA